MAYLGKSEYGLDKSYLYQVASDIAEGKKIKFKQGTETIDISSPEVKSFITMANNPKKKEANVIKILKSGKHYANIFVTKKGKAFAWNDIDKSPYSGQGGKSDAKSTAMQERASMYAIEQGLNKNGYKDKKKFLTDCKKKLKQLYPDMDSQWEETFFQQQLTVAANVKNNVFSHYSRDDGFMGDITKLVKGDPFNISKKDSWNPADIWLVNNPKKHMEELKKCISLTSLNEKLRLLFDSEEVIGISLKKISGKQARWELVNVDASLFKNMPKFLTGVITCKFNIEENGEVESTDTVYEVKKGDKSNAGAFQIRQNSKGFNNLKVEGRIAGAGAARSGKAPLDLLEKSFKDYKIRLNNDHNKYPKTTKEFRSRSAEFQKMFSSINSKITSNIKTSEFITNMEQMFKSEPDIAMSKLMQVDFLYQVLIRIKSKKKRDDLTTNMFFLAQKKGPIFGPFGKLY